MLPVKTEKTDRAFGPPPGEEDSIGTLPYYFGEEYGYQEVVSVWKLSDAEREAIANGSNVELGVGWLGQFPPVRLGVTDDGMEK